MVAIKINSIFHANVNHFKRKRKPNVTLWFPQRKWILSNFPFASLVQFPRFEVVPVALIVYFDFKYFPLFRCHNYVMGMAIKAESKQQHTTEFFSSDFFPFFSLTRKFDLWGYYWVRCLFAMRVHFVGYFQLNFLEIIVMWPMTRNLFSRMDGHLGRS